MLRAYDNTGRALGVDAVLEGTLQRDGDRTRVTLRLLNVANGAQLWSGNFDEAASDIFKLEDSISQQVGETLFANLSQDEKAFVYTPAKPKQQVIRGMVQEFIHRVFNGSAEPLLLHLVEDEGLTAKDLTEIAKLARRKS